MVGPKGSGCEWRARVIEDTSPVKPMGVRTARGAPLSRAKFPDCGNCDHTPTDMCFGWEEQRPTWGAPNTSKRRSRYPSYSVAKCLANTSLGHTPIKWARNPATDNGAAVAQLQSRGFSLQAEAASIQAEAEE